MAQTIPVQAFRILLMIPFLVLFTVKATGQNKKIKFSSINQVGLLSGSTGEAFMLQTINGLKKDNWFAGLGTGLDFYRERTIPLFLDIRRDLIIFNRINTPFIYADAGMNFSWLKATQREQKQFPTSSPGLVYDVGIGWKLSGKHNRGYIFSAGYSFKQVKEKVKYLWWSAPTVRLESENYERYTYLYRRIVVKVGIIL